MERVRKYFEFLAQNHRLLGHREYDPHFAYLNDEKDMLLPAQMAYPFVLLGHNGYQVTDDGDHLRWSVVLSVQTHVTDTGDDREKNMAVGLCGRILNDLLSRARSMEARLDNRWLTGLDLSGAMCTPVENESEGLYGWVIEFGVVLPWCRKVEDEKWMDLRDIIQ